MNDPQHFQHLFVGWALGLGFITLMVLVGFIWNMVYLGKFRNPFAPFIRAFEASQKHRQAVKMMRLKAQLVHNGMDPEYVTFMEKELKKEE